MQTPSAQSPGGIWLGSDSAPAAVTLYIAETGTLKAQLSLPGATRLSFGTGLVAVSSGDVLDGSFELRGPLEPGSIEQDDLGCAISGTVAERQSMSVDISCADDNGIVYDESVTLSYDYLHYEAGSSLDELAGNYTLAFSPDTNTLNISGDGTIFGMYDNGARCTVNGRASIIDPAYALIAVDWSFSGCTDALGIFEGIEMSGFAMPNPSTNFAPEGYYFLLTGTTSRGLHVISVLYEPA